MKKYLIATILSFCLSLSADNLKPNIIFLFADDQRADTIGAHGNPHILTPNLDKLSESGFSFTRNYCAGSFSGAVCVASRSMLMTGRQWMQIPGKNKNSDWSGMTLLPKYLQDSAGYETFIIGKWHNGLKTLNSAFSNGRSVYMGGMADHADFEVQDYVNGTLSQKRKAGAFSSTEFANAAVDYIKNAKTEQPFFLYVAFMAPHDPRNPPEKYRQMYYSKRPPLPENYLPLHPFKNAPQATMGRDEGLAPWPRTKEVISDQLCEYYGLITQLDEQVGRIMESVKNSPHADNTIIIYTADHGLAMGSHGLLGKQNIYEQSMRCPLIISGKGIPGGRSQAYSYIHDLYPTICEWAGLDKPQGVTSLNLNPLIKGKAVKVRDNLFLPFQNSQRAVSNGKWKLHIYPQINHSLLFDLENDPHEMNNLAGSNPEMLKEMIKLMEAERARFGDKDPLSVKNPASKNVDYTKGKRTLDKWQPKWIRNKYFDGRNDPDHGSKK